MTLDRTCSISSGRFCVSLIFWFICDLFLCFLNEDSLLTTLDNHRTRYKFNRALFNRSKCYSGVVKNAILVMKLQLLVSLTYGAFLPSDNVPWKAYKSKWLEGWLYQVIDPSISTRMRHPFKRGDHWWAHFWAAQTGFDEWYERVDGSKRDCNRANALRYTGQFCTV